MIPLYLTQAEKKQFDALPDNLKEGWEVKEETLQFEDTEERQRVRIELMKIHDSKLVAFKNNAEKTTDPAEMVKLLDELDFKKISNADLTELFYGLGPNFISAVIKVELSTAENDEDLELIESFCFMRHVLLESFIPAYS